MADDTGHLTREDFNLLLAEIRANRISIEKVNSTFLQENKELWTEVHKTNITVTTLKSRFALVAITFGLAGSKIANYIPFLR